jgi:hypothetical protein
MHCVCLMQSFGVLKQVVHIVTSGLCKVCETYTAVCTILPSVVQGSYLCIDPTVLTDRSFARLNNCV